MRFYPCAVVALALSQLAFSDAMWATPLRITCRDGESTSLVHVGRIELAGLGPFRTTEPVCDFDQTCDGACTFAFCGLGEFLCAHHPACVGPSSGICQPGSAPPDQFVVPVGRRQLLPDAGFGFDVLLRCRRSPACP